MQTKRGVRRTARSLRSSAKNRPFEHGGPIPISLTGVAIRIFQNRNSAVRPIHTRPFGVAHVAAHLDNPKSSLPIERHRNSHRANGEGMTGVSWKRKFQVVPKLSGLTIEY